MILMQREVFLLNAIIQLCETDQDKGEENNHPSQEVKPQGSKSIYSAPLSQIGSSTNLQNSEFSNILTNTV